MKTITKEKTRSTYEEIKRRRKEKYSLHRKRQPPKKRYNPIKGKGVISGVETEGILIFYSEKLKKEFIIEKRKNGYYLLTGNPYIPITELGVSEDFIPDSVYTPSELDFILNHDIEDILPQIDRIKSHFRGSRITQIIENEKINKGVGDEN